MKAAGIISTEKPYAPLKNIGSGTQKRLTIFL
jgi:hypothetical protein